ncbi:MAG: hypothetical protein AMXMBFR13_26020 [Phycisphaerae bacterium]
MNDYCPDCGNRFTEPRDLTSLWLRLLECPIGCGHFLEMGDSRWIYPLQRLEPEAARGMLDAPADAIKEARAHIQQVDYKTISIVAFEEALRKD